VLLSHFAAQSSYAVHVFRADKLLRFSVPINQGYTLERYMLVPLPDATPTQLDNRSAWMQVH
jgi:predicted metalloprotease with PDZ domain